MSPTRWLRIHWDRIAGWSTVLAGAIVLTAGWVGASGTPYPAAQLPYLLSGGLGGLFLLGVGGTLLLSADLRDEWHKLDAIEAALSREVGRRTVDPIDGDATARPAGTRGDADAEGSDALTVVATLGAGT